MTAPVPAAAGVPVARACALVLRHNPPALLANDEAGGTDRDLFALASTPHASATVREEARKRLASYGETLLEQGVSPTGVYPVETPRGYHEGERTVQFAAYLGDHAVDAVLPLFHFDPDAPSGSSEPGYSCRAYGDVGLLTAPAEAIPEVRAVLRRYGVEVPTQEAEPVQREGIGLTPDRTALAVRFRYDAAIASEVRAIPGARMTTGDAHGGESSDRYWAVPIASGDHLMSVARAFGIPVDDDARRALERGVLGPVLPYSASKTLGEVLEQAPDVRVDPAWFEVGPDGVDLYPYQRVGVAALANLRRLVIADQMGLGKSVQALVGARAAGALDGIRAAGGPEEDGEERPRDGVLVVCPASLKLNWAREAAMWLPECAGGEGITVLSGRSSPLVGGSKRPYHVTAWGERVEVAVNALTWWEDEGDGPPVRRRCRVAVVNYDILEARADDLARHGFAAIVVDEAHYMKNPRAKRTSALKRLMRGTRIGDIALDPPQPIPVRAVLTGTPVLNRPNEIVAPLEAIGRLHDVHPYGAADFKRTFSNAATASALKHLHRQLVSQAMVRRLKADVLHDLPSKVRATIPVEIDNRAEYQRAEEKLFAHIRDRAASDRAFLASIERLPAAEREAKIAARATSAEEAARRAAELARINALRRTAAEGKVEEAVRWASDFVSGGQKLILFAHHREIQQALREGIQESLGEGRYVVAVTGGQSPAQREAAVTAFQQDENAVAIVCSLKAAGVGITLTAASDVAFVEMDWTPAAHDQAEDRCVLEGEPVLTPTGWRPIEEIEVGDLVVTHTGAWREVTDTWGRRAKGSHAHNTKTITEIHVRGWHRPLRVTSDHRMLTPDGWIEAGRLMPSDRLSMPGSYEAKAVAERRIEDSCRLPKTFDGPGGEQANGRLVSLPETMLLTSDTMFAIGYYLGDGFASTGTEKGRFVSLAGHQDQADTHLARIASWAEAFGVNGTTHHSKRDRGAELRLYSGELALWFQLHFGRILSEKALPPWVFDLSRHQRREIVNGWVAADGYERIPSRGGSLRREIITAREDLAAQAAMLLMSVGEKPCVYYGEQARAWTIGWTEGVEPTLTISRVTHRLPNKTERVYDLTVDGDESFVVGTAAAHNCHRIGQEDSVTAWYILGADTIDEEIAALIEAKRVVVDAATDGQTESGAGSSVYADLQKKLRERVA